MDTLLQVVADEPVPPRQLQSQTPRDLETICLKCLRKEPGQRYASAAELADDLGRYLGGRPTRARPAGSGERVVKWVKRRPAAAALVVVSGLTVLSLVGLAVGLAYNGRLQAALREAERLKAEADEFKRVLDWHRREAEGAEKSRHWPRAAWHLKCLSDHQPTDGFLWARLGRAHAELGQWPQAASGHARAVELGATQEDIWYRHALLRLKVGDARGYREACAHLLGRFGETRDPRVANAVAWACTLGPEAVADPQQPVRLAERALASRPEDANLLNTLGAALYRSGQHEAAVGRLHEARKARGAGGPPFDFLFLAMAEQRRNHRQEARKWWVKAVHWVDPASQPQSSAPAELSWTDRLELELLRKEAGALLGPRIHNWGA
jgi:tetratricopeptide (TPR) repeat protein